MAFKLTSRMDPAVVDYDPVDGETYVYGECVKLTAGNKVTKAGPTDAVAGVTVHQYPDPTEVFPKFAKKVRVIPVDTEQIWEADYVGTPDARFVTGAADIQLDDTGASLNAAAATGNGPCSVLSINADKSKALVKFKNRQLT